MVFDAARSVGRQRKEAQHDFLVDRVVRLGLRAGRFPAARGISLGSSFGNARIFYRPDSLGLSHGAGSSPWTFRAPAYPHLPISPAADAAGVQSPYR